MTEPEKMGKPSSTVGAGKKKKERWLLTRKTWRYMADAGRRLIPEGHHRADDLPKIEAYFQDVCTKEPTFLLWRKQSYPGALGFRRNRRRKKGGSCRGKTSSADEAEDIRNDQPSTSGASRLDLRKLKEEFLFGKQGEDELLGTLQNYLYGSSDMASLFDKLREQLDHITSRRPAIVNQESKIDTSLLEILRKYYAKSTNREKVIGDFLTDRKKLERLYYELRKARGFAVRSKWRSSRSYNEEEEEEDGDTEGDIDTGESSTAPNSPLVVEPIQRSTTLGTQTSIIAPHSWEIIAEEVTKVKAVKEAEIEKELKANGNRRSSVDNDDVSPSVSDTIKRYLRMARKKSVDSDKADRFKRVNYDRNLRNIKGKGEPPISEDDGTDKSAQTDETWIEALRDLKIETFEVDYPNSSRSSLTEGTISPTSPTTKSFLSSGQTFLSNLLHGLQDKTSTVPGGGGGGTMHKSKSSTNVVQTGSRLVAKKIWKSRSKSQSRATPSATSAWTPQGRCIWSNVSGRTITLTDTTLQQLSELERRILQKVALAKLQALNLGVNVKIPSETNQPTAVQKPKRKAYLLKRKAITTGFFDGSRKDDKEKTSESCSSGVVFGIPLNQCVENERARNTQGTQEESHLELRRKSHHGSRGSFSSLVEASRHDERGSCESLIGPTLSMPRLDDISCGSAHNLYSQETPRVPYLVTSCLNHLESRGLNTLGIFRVSSSKKRVRQLREDYDCGKEINLDNELCPHDVATLLKEYFRDLPDSLLCKDLYQAFIHTQRIRNRRLQHEALQHLLQLLPVANRDTLYSLLALLALVAVNSDDHRDSSGEWVPGNKMDSSNLATLFAPNILHSCSKRTGKEELSQERMDERSDAINVVRCLIDNYRDLYQVSAELLDEVYVHMMDSHPEALDQLMRRRDTAGDDIEDPNLEDDKKFWSREACTHENAGMGGPDMSMRPRKIERSRDRLSKKRRDEYNIRKRQTGVMASSGESGSSSRRASDEKRLSSSDSGHLSPQDSTSEGVITASLKIPVPVTSFLLNLDDIPYIEDSDRQQITLGLMKCGGATTSESGVGSFPATRPPSVSSSWGSTSPEEPGPGTLFPSRQEALRVTISTTPQVHQVHPSYARSEHTSERISKSASSSSMASTSPVPTSISSIGGAVLRSKTADIERMLRLSSTSEKEFKRRHARAELRTEGQSTTREETKNIGFWKRREIISSEPKDCRKHYFASIAKD